MCRRPRLFACDATALFRDPSREQPAIRAAVRDLMMTPEALALRRPKDAKKKK